MRSLTLRRRSARERCSYCHDALRGEAAALWQCPLCATLVHGDCATLHGRCPLLGCRAIVRRPDAPPRIGSPWRFFARVLAAPFAAARRGDRAALLAIGAVQGFLALLLLDEIAIVGVRHFASSIGTLATSTPYELLGVLEAMLVRGLAVIGLVAALALWAALSILGARAVVRVLELVTLSPRGALEGWTFSA